MSVELATIYEILRRQADAHPDATAVQGLNAADLSYRGLVEQIDRMAAALAGWGIGRGDRVVIQITSGPEAFVLMHAVGAAAVSVLIDAQAGAEEVAHFLRFTQAKAIMIERGAENPGRALAQEMGVRVIEVIPTPEVGAGTVTFAEAPPAAATPALNMPDDLSYLFTTSGTTALPKLVPKTQRALPDYVSTLIVSQERTTGETRPLRTLCCLPMHISYSVAMTTAALVTGGTAAVMPGFDPRRVYQWLDSYRPTFLAGAPAMLEQMLALAPENQEIVARHSIRFVNTGGASLPAATCAALHRVFAVPVIAMYAMTEINRIGSRVIRPDDALIELSNRAEDLARTRVMASDGSLLPPGGVGEIVVKSDAFTGYWNNPEANADAFIDGWFRTGDEGSIDADGNITMIGRIKEVINSGGAKVSPQEVEAVLKQHSEVVDAVVFGIRHPEIGEAVAAAVVGTASERELRKFASERLPFYKVPMRIVIVPEIPVSPSGKVQRKRLAELLDLK